MTQLTDAAQKASELKQELVKTGKREQLTIIVPKDNLLEVEARVENNDIGFVFPKQAGTVKIETFNYTKYGTLSGKVTTVPDDAISDEKKGLIYHARVLLDKTHVQVENKQVNLSPLMEYAHESLGER